MTATSGNVIDYDVIEEKIIQLSKKFVISVIVFDRMFATGITNHIQGQGIDTFDVSQNYKGSNSPTRELERICISKKT